MSKKTPSMSCPCGGGQYQNCCEPFHLGIAVAPSAEKMMRSRYSAYVLKNAPYLLDTWHDSTRPTETLFENDGDLKWTELKIKQFSKEPNATEAWVEFVAVFKISGKAHKLHEISSFVCEDGKWLYLDGEFPE